MSKKNEKAVDLDLVMRTLSEGMRTQIAKPNLYAYRPHEKQLLFHKSSAHSRLYIGGNRSGKTTGGVVEDCYWLMKKHPYRRMPLPEGPIRGRAVAVDFNYGVAQILLPEFARWLPPSFLKNGSWEDSYSREYRVLTLANGSSLEFKSYDQDLEKFAGTSRHFTHYDEEPPQHIYNECQARLVDTNGYSWLTMTPVEGMSWVHDDLYLPGTEGTDDDVAVIEVDMLDNPHIGAEAAERYLKTLSADERKAREHGTFVTLGGLVFKNFNKDAHVVEHIIPPKSWKWYVSIDHGYNNPTAIYWHAVSPDGEVVTFHEYYEREKTVEEHAAYILARNAEFGRIPDLVVGDPAMKQRQGVTGTSIIQEYAKYNIFVAEANNDVASGVDKMNQYLKMGPDNKPKWQITESCPSLIWEMQRLRWKRWASKKMEYENNRQEVIHKKDDHACDSCRYFFTIMPELAPIAPSFPAQGNILDKHAAAVGAVHTVPATGRTDPNFSKPRTSWNATVGSDIQGFEY